MDLNAEDWSEEEKDDDSIEWWGSDDEEDAAEDYDDFAVSNLQGKGKSTTTKNKSKSKVPKESTTVKDQSMQLDLPRSELKVELKSVTLLNETKNLIMDTLRTIHGQNFSMEDVEVKSSSTRKLKNQYWVDRGRLVVKGFYNYSIKKNIDRDKVNSLLMECLERCGFYTNHCYEALVHTNNDLEQAIEVLLRAYFGHVFQNVPNSNLSKNIAEMDDELSSLKSIFEEIVEEKTRHKHWVFHLELIPLAEWYFAGSVNRYEASVKYQKPSSSKPLCRYFNLGKCTYGDRCRFQHVKNSEEVKKNSVSDGALKLKAKFDLEIRFPDNCNYPADIPLILLVPQHPEFSSYACLRITQFLLQKASTCTDRKTVFCYDLIESLLNPEEILQYLKAEHVSKLDIDPQASLFPCEEDERDIEENHFETASTASGEFSKPRRALPQEVPNRDQEIIDTMRRNYDTPRFHEMLRLRQKLPAWDCRDRILEELKHSQVLVVVGDTGCGKTTQIPQFILDEWLYASAGLSDRKSPCDRVEIICTQPRRLSAIGVANRVAQERTERLGDLIGFQIRLESNMSSLTRLLFCTTGILLKKLEVDPLLESVTHVIVDEVHERSEESDFLLLILKDMIKIRKDLKVLLMSATVNAELFSSYFDGAPMITIPGKMYPVEELYFEDILERIDYVIDEYSKNCRKVNKTLGRQVDEINADLLLADSMSRNTYSADTAPDETLTAQQLFFRYQNYSKKTKKTLLLLDSEKIDPELVVSVIAWIVNGHHNYPREGSILVFLPGIADIMAVNDELIGHNFLSPNTGNFIVIPLHSTISNEEQGAVFRKTPRHVRKIVLSTNIAETSITIDDCVFVIDSGKMRETRFDTDRNITSLETMWISKANAKQRKGRAGRVMPGLCIRLYTSYRHEYAFKAQPVPEIQRVALDQVILCTKILENFKTKTIMEVLGEVIEPPERNSIETAIVRLQDVGALDDKEELTALGRHLSVLPVDVKIGKLILFGAIFCCLDAVLTIAASLSNKSPFLSPFGKRDEAEKAKRRFAKGNSDHLTILKAYNDWRSVTARRYNEGRRFAEVHFLSWRTLEMIGDLKHQYLDLLVDIGFAKLKSNIRRRRRGDRVIEMIPQELNEYSDNHTLLSSILCASLYPNLVKVLTPDKIYTYGISGAIPKEHTADELKFKTKTDGFVFLHPSSVNHNIADFSSPYLVYQEKMKTSRIFIHDSTMVNAVSLILFAGNELKIESIELNDTTNYTVSLENGWLVFTFRSLQDAKMMKHIRSEFDKLLEKKIENPSLNLADNKVGKLIISTMVHILSNTK